MLIKVCGMCDRENIALIDSAGADILGFIFYDQSKRFAGINPIEVAVRSMKAGVFVNASIGHIIDVANSWGLDYIQLHGDEPPETCDTIKHHGFKVIKAISVCDLGSIAQAYRYEGRADILLFDTKCVDYGGSGQTFDWSILQAYRGETPFMLSGGLGPDNIQEIKAFCHPKCIGIDLNSKFETAPGLKNVDLVTNFIKQIRQ